MSRSEPAAAHPGTPHGQAASRARLLHLIFAGGFALDVPLEDDQVEVPDSFGMLWIALPLAQLSELTPLDPSLIESAHHRDASGQLWRESECTLEYTGTPRMMLGLEETTG